MEDPARDEELLVDRREVARRFGAGTRSARAPFDAFIRPAFWCDIIDPPASDRGW